MDVADLIAESEIRKVLSRYARAIDSKDRDLVRTCYHDDATDDHMRYSGPAKGYIDQLWTGRPYRMTHHFLGNPAIDVDGDVAHVETYCMSTHILDRDEIGPERVWLLWVRYEDRFERRDNEWRIAARVVHFDGDLVQPVTSTEIPRGRPGR